MSEGDSPRPVELRTRFDQFPATIKGAFVLQGADGNPHAVDIQRCEVARIPTGPTRPLPVEARVDVAPGRDLFVPFETAIGDLEPGWYALHSTIRVDAGGTWSFSSRGFVVPWPRDQVRRGTVKVGAAVGAGPGGLVIEAVEMRGDCTIVSWHPAGSGGEDRPKRGPRMRLLADGGEVEALPVEARPAGARPAAPPHLRAVFYPVPREAGSLGLVVTAAGQSQRIDIPFS